MKITIITDDPESWYIPFGEELRKQLVARGHETFYVHSNKEIVSGDICFLLSCTRILGEEKLKLNAHNIVVHASDLPSGRGWSPLQWQILEGKNDITLTMIEAVAGMDEGPYYLKSIINYDGSELLAELREKMAREINQMCVHFVETGSNKLPIQQDGPSSYFRKRIDADDELDTHKSIQEMFNHFRIADNAKHPVYFRHLGKKYFIKIFPEKVIPGTDVDKG